MINKVLVATDTPRPSGLVVFCVGDPRAVSQLMYLCLFIGVGLTTYFY